MSLAVAALLAVGMVFAETFHYSLPGQGVSGSVTGTTWIALPETTTFPAITDCGDLLAHVPFATAVARYDATTDGVELCSCPGTCFAIEAGRAYRVTVSATSEFEIVGTDGAVPMTLDPTGVGSSLSGNQVIALPFHASSADAFDLIQEIEAAAGSPAVDLVGEWDTTSDTFTTYDGNTGSAFPLVPGQGYLVQVNASVTFTPGVTDQDDCASPSTCIFRGLTVNALGAATLALDGSDNLVVSNLGTSGGDGVRVLAPPAARTGHEEWIDLGHWVQESVVIQSTMTEPQIRTESRATAARGPMPADFLMALTQISSNQILIDPGLNPTGTTLMRWEVWSSGTRTGCVPNQSVDSTATATGWPNDHAHSVLKWASPVTIGLPGGSIAVGNELRLIPENPSANEVTDSEWMDILVDSENLASLTSITITAADFDAIPDQPSSACPPIFSAPATSMPVTAALALALLGAGAWLIRRRFAGGP